MRIEYVFTQEYSGYSADHVIEGNKLSIIIRSSLSKKNASKEVVLDDETLKKYLKSLMKQQNILIQ